jgi:hypothetical protein
MVWFIFTTPDYYLLIILGELRILKSITSHYDMWLIIDQVILVNDQWVYVGLNEPNQILGKVYRWYQFTYPITPKFFLQCLLNENFLVHTYPNNYLLEVHLFVVESIETISLFNFGFDGPLFQWGDLHILFYFLSYL